MDYTKIIDKYLEPKDKLVSVIDSFDAIGKVLKVAQRVKNRQTIASNDINEVVMNSMYTLGFYPFWQAHGQVFRPIMLKALSSDNDIVKDFFVEAIPTALTIAMPNRQLDYFNISESVKDDFEKG